MKKCLIWGTGRLCELLMLYAVWKEDIKIVGFLQSAKTERKKEFKGELLNIYCLPEISDDSYDVIILANCFYKEILETIKSKGMDESKLVIPYTVDNETNKLEVINRISSYVHNPEIVVSALSIALHPSLRDGMLPMTFDNTEYTIFNDIKICKEKNFTTLYGDYTRVRNLELCISEIKEKNLTGAMAEVGVFRGTFVKMFTHYFPEKDIYLYDTFDGFVEDDYKNEVENGNFSSEWMQVFKETNLENVKKNIGNEEKCHYRIGYFPDTIEETEKNEEFCLVSLDADMYNPILDGLRFFYPRLQAGGYIFVHEYNARMLNDSEVMPFCGVKDAIRDFEKEVGHICYVPIADRNGTLIITK